MSVSSISRRGFVKSAAAYTAAASFLSAGALRLRANPLGMPIGCQTWPVRKMIGDFPGTIKQLAGAGFQSIELCSPVGYADEGFAGLGKYKGAELRKILGDTGVRVPQAARAALRLTMRTATPIKRAGRAARSTSGQT